MPQGPLHTKGASATINRPLKRGALWITLCSKMGLTTDHSDKAVHKNIKVHTKQYDEIVKTDLETVEMISINVEKDLRE
jgi:hypothetical protein